MKKIYTKLMLLLVLSVFINGFNANAKWELLNNVPATCASHVTESGNLLMADFRFDDNSGGIYISEDGGATWTKTDVADHCYANFLEVDGYIFATGEGCNLAISTDEGKTWKVNNFADVYSDVLSEDALIADPCYAIAWHNDKLYLSDFNGGGVIYSEDYGETWTLTDRDSMSYGTVDSVGEMKRAKGGVTVENIYQLRSFNGSLYAFGVYFVFRLDEDSMMWETVKTDSNFMAVSTEFDGKMVCGRSVMNDTDKVGFLEYTLDGYEWGDVNRPEGIIDNNVRAINSDDKYIFVGLQNGGMYCTADFGESWSFISEGLPGNLETRYFSDIVDIDVDDEYVYVTVYQLHLYDAKGSGLYRMAKADLPEASVKSLTQNNLNTYYANNALIVGAADKVQVVSLDGTTSNVKIENGMVDVSSLSPGVYVYKAITGNEVVTGKFIKR